MEVKSPSLIGRILKETPNDLHQHLHWPSEYRVAVGHFGINIRKELLNDTSNICNSMIICKMGRLPTVKQDTHELVCHRPQH
jgi:hypothetical protein